jgi:hypothetical protein
VTDIHLSDTDIERIKILAEVKEWGRHLKQVTRAVSRISGELEKKIHRLSDDDVIYLAELSLSLVEVAERFQRTVRRFRCSDGGQVR